MLINQAHDVKLKQNTHKERQLTHNELLELIPTQKGPNIKLKHEKQLVQRLYGGVVLYSSHGFKFKTQIW